MAFMYDSGTDSEAVKRVMDQFEKGAFSCAYCNPACREQTFPVTTSSVKWPAEKYEVNEYLNLYIFISRSWHSCLGTDQATKTDEFSENGGVISNPKIRFWTFI